MLTTSNTSVRAAGVVELPAPPEVVWDIISNIERWPCWNTDVKWARLNGDLRKGTTFDWKAGPGVIHSTLTEVEEGSMMSWTGSMFGIHASHLWRLEGSESGTRMSTFETWTGPLPRAFPRSLTKSLQAAVDRGLEAISVIVAA
jgi:uncharacterized protein YndB with AHSA1/START domain